MVQTLELEMAVGAAVLLPAEAARVLRVCRETLRRGVVRGEVHGALRIGRCLRFLTWELLGTGAKLSLPAVCTVGELSQTLRVHPDTVRAAVKRELVEGVQWVGAVIRFDTARVIASMRCQAPESRKGILR